MIEPNSSIFYLVIEWSGRVQLRDQIRIKNDNLTYPVDTVVHKVRAFLANQTKIDLVVHIEL